MKLFTGHSAIGGYCCDVIVDENSDVGFDVHADRSFCPTLVVALQVVPDSTCGSEVVRI